MNLKKAIQNPSSARKASYAEGLKSLKGPDRKLIGGKVASGKSIGLKSGGAVKDSMCKKGGPVKGKSMKAKTIKQIMATPKTPKMHPVTKQMKDMKLSSKIGTPPNFSVEKVNGRKKMAMGGAAKIRLGMATKSGKVKNTKK